MAKADERNHHDEDRHVVEEALRDLRADPAVPVEQALEWLTWDENEEALRPDPMAAAGPGYRWRASERRGEVA
jgi:hypothetical protein